MPISPLGWGCTLTIPLGGATISGEDEFRKTGAFYPSVIDCAGEKPRGYARGTTWQDKYVLMHACFNPL